MRNYLSQYIPLDYYVDKYVQNSNISPLHYLYPGVPMNASWDYNIDNITLEDVNIEKSKLLQEQISVINPINSDEINRTRTNINDLISPIKLSPLRNRKNFRDNTFGIIIFVIFFFILLISIASLSIYKK